MAGKDLDLKSIEEKWRKYWEKEKIYKFNPRSKKKIYSIDTPPPYASSGHLHVGHALHYTQFEIIARVMRLLGYEVYFAPGFDDNGLPTEKYVEEKLGIKKSKISRAEFRKICLLESQKVEKKYINRVFKTLGHSYDWGLLYTTISPESQKVAQTSFLKLIKSKDCYRKEEPVIWCPYHETALAQAEVEDLARTTKLNYIAFDLVGENKKVTIATTRPEFLPACVGIFVNPKDKKNNNLIGKELIVPLFNQKVKIRADEKVDGDFGTGVVMVCTFGDSTDIEWWKKHKLDLKPLLNDDGTLNELGGKYEGCSVKEAREKILNELEKEKRLKKTEKLQQTVGVCWRCNTPVEYIVAKQWFVKTLKYKKELIKRAKEINWIPGFMRLRFDNWTENLGWDWIISRQRYYGVPIPVWYCENCGEIILPKESELPIDPLEKEMHCPKCKKLAIPDSDVFDTWMTSSNTPEVACRWLENSSQYKKIVPMSLRPQSHDIIRTWAFYTILKSHLLFDRKPWENVMVGTFVLDEKGKGMHKSKGNAIWADELVEQYGVDAFRYWVGTATMGTDLPFKEKELIAGKRFLTKLWNASNFVFGNLKNYKRKKPHNLEKIDLWMLQRLSKVVESVKKSYLNYNIAGAKREAEDFFWHVFCDYYLEIIKKRIYNKKGDKQLSAQYVLYESLLAVLKMMAPITPFITEEIYQEHFKKFEKDKSLHISKWPVFKKTKEKSVVKKYEKGELGFDKLNLLIDLISKIRQEKTKAQKPMNAECIITISRGEFEDLKDVLEDLKAVTNAIEIKKGDLKVEFK